MRSRPGSRDPHFHAGSRTARPMHYRARCSTSFSSLRRSPSLPWPGPTSASAIGSRERHEPRIRHRSRRGLGPRHLPGLRASRAGVVPAMTAVGWAQIALYFLVLLLLIKPAGAYMFRVFEGTRQPLPAVFGRLERFVYRVCGVDPEREQRWTVYALFLVSQGVLQNLSPYRELVTLEGGKQIVAMGPVASQEAIKMLGTNGGGFFNANSAHPFENPTPLSNFVQMLSIFVIPAGLTYTYGRMARDQRQGWALFCAMAALFIAGVVCVYAAESRGNPALRGFAHLEQTGNLEGKEARFGVPATALFATVTTDASCGAVNGMHDSFTPLGGLVPLVNIQLGEVIFGGVGAGLYGMLIFVVL